MKRPTITAVNHYEIYPFNHGGSLGIRGLYKALSEWFDVNIITFVETSSYIKTLNINNHVKVISLPLPKELLEKQNKLAYEYGFSEKTIIDSSPAVVRWYHQYHELVDEVREIAKDSVIVIAEHVFTWNIIKEACPDKHLWYRANNVEYDYKLTTWDKVGCPQDLLQETFDLEKECCENAEKILTVSQLEKERFISLYEIEEVKQECFMNIKSGYDTDDLDFVLPSGRKSIDSNYKMSGIFIASNTPYTVKAVENCIKIAKECPDILIIVAGRVASAFSGRELPKNVIMAGLVTDEVKWYYLKSCDFALNLLEDGAGINVKMFEYFAFGIPVITTKHGARGIELKHNKNCVLTDAENYVNDVQTFANMSASERDLIARNALQLLEEKYSWRSLARNIALEIQKMYAVNIEDSRVPLEDIRLIEYKNAATYIPEGDFYIRCAGNYGRAYLDNVTKKSRRPVAFVDNNLELVGKNVDGIPVISEDQFISQNDGREIVVATARFANIVRTLVNKGISKERISLSGEMGLAFSFRDLKGEYSYYQDKEVLRKEALGELA